MNFYSITLQEVKEYLHIDFNEDDLLIQMLMQSAIGYIETITKKKVDQWEEVPVELNQAFLYLVSLWYEQRLPIGSVPNEIAFTISMLLNPHNGGGVIDG